MALGLKNLAENISDAVSGIIGIFVNQERNKPYPETEAFKPVIALYEQSNWAKSVPYAFGVAGDTGISGTTAQIAQFSDFVLPINPSEINQDENFAINIKPTQGGTVVQHSGNRYKDLVISGTTGVHPFRKDGGALLKTGIAIAQPDKMKFRSGYEVFHMLRNYFRVYYEYKKTRPDAKDLRLLFKNFKDGEFLIVELLKFSMKRSATRPTMYDYTLQFKVLGHELRRRDESAKGFLGFLDKVDSTLDSALSAIDIARGVILRAQGIVRQIEANVDAVFLEPLRKTALTIKEARATAKYAVDMPKRIWNQFNSEGTAIALLLGLKSKQEAQSNSGQLDPRLAQVTLPANIEETAKTQGVNFFLDQPNDMLMAMDVTDFPKEAQDLLAADQATQAQLPRSFFEDIREDFVRLRNNAADKFGLGSADYNELYDRTPTFEAEAGKVVTDAELEVLYGLNQAIRGLNLMLSVTTLFKSPYEDRIANVQNTFNDDLGLQVEAAVEEIKLPANMDLETLALRELGSAARWIEIAELNDLKPPYIVQDKSDTTYENVKYPGTSILIPRPVISGFGPLAQQRRSAYDIVENLTELERNLGRDIRLTKDFDFELDNRNDYALISGAQNAAQAILLKLSYERGDLFNHPSIGVGVIVGTKVPNISEIQTAILQSLLQDPRFEDVKNLQIFREGSAIRLKFEVKIKSVDIPIPLDLKL